VVQGDRSKKRLRRVVCIERTLAFGDRNVFWTFGMVRMMPIGRYVGRYLSSWLSTAL
jgi:hypothetical protein